MLEMVERVRPQPGIGQVSEVESEGGVCEAGLRGGEGFSGKGEHFLSDLTGLNGEGETTFFCFLS